MLVQLPLLILIAVSWLRCLGKRTRNMFLILFIGKRQEEPERAKQEM